MLNGHPSILARLCVHDRCLCEIKTQNFQNQVYLFASFSKPLLFNIIRAIILTVTEDPCVIK